MLGECQSAVLLIGTDIFTQCNKIASITFKNVWQDLAELAVQCLVLKAMEADHVSNFE